MSSYYFFIIIIIITHFLFCTQYNCTLDSTLYTCQANSFASDVIWLSDFVNVDICDN